MKKLIEKALILSIPLLLFVWILVSFLVRSFLPSDTRRDVFFWIILYAILVFYFLFKFKAKLILFFGLTLISFGAIFSIFGNINTSESVLRFGYVFMLVGSVFALIEAFKNGGKN